MKNIWQGTKVQLRGLQLEDAEVLATLPRNTEADSFSSQTHLPLNRTLEWEQHYIAREIKRSKETSHDECKLAIVTIEGNRWVGLVGLNNSNRRQRSTFIDVAIAPDSEYGKGYAKEAMLLLMNYTFNELGYHRIALYVDERNARGIKLYQNLGFVQEGRLRENYYGKGRYWDEFLMSMLQAEFNAKYQTFIDLLYNER